MMNYRSILTDWSYWICFGYLVRKDPDFGLKYSWLIICWIKRLLSRLDQNIIYECTHQFSKMSAHDWGPTWKAVSLEIRERLQQTFWYWLEGGGVERLLMEHVLSLAGLNTPLKIGTDKIDCDRSSVFRSARQEHLTLAAEVSIRDETSIRLGEFSALRTFSKLPSNQVLWNDKNCNSLREERPTSANCHLWLWRLHCVHQR